MSGSPRVPPSERAVLATVASGTVLAPLNSTMIAVALPQVLEEFGTGVAQGDSLPDRLGLPPAGGGQSWGQDGAATPDPWRVDLVWRRIAGSGIGSKPAGVPDAGQRGRAGARVRPDRAPGLRLRPGLGRNCSGRRCGSAARGFARRSRRLASHLLRQFATRPAGLAVGAPGNTGEARPAAESSFRPGQGAVTVCRVARCGRAAGRLTFWRAPVVGEWWGRGHRLTSCSRRSVVCWPVAVAGERRPWPGRLCLPSVYCLSRCSAVGSSFPHSCSGFALPALGLACRRRRWRKPASRPARHER